MKLGFVDPLIRLDVPFSNSSVDYEMVENTPILNSNILEQYSLNYDHELNTKSQKWDTYIANKKSVMKIILNRYDEDTRAEIALGSSHEDNPEVGELIKFLARVRKICNSTEDTYLFFGSQVIKIIKHHFRPTTIVK